MARLRSAPIAHRSVGTEAQHERPALREKTNIECAKAPVYDNDGNTEGLVKNSKVRRGRSRGLGQRDTASAGETALMTTDEMAKSDPPPLPNAVANKRPPRMTRKPLRSEAQSTVLESLKRRMEETARKEAGKKDRLPAKRILNPSVSALAIAARTPAVPEQTSASALERSGYDLSPSPPPSGKLSSTTKRSSSVAPTSLLRPQSTPAMDTCVLRKFKRRPRQPSMLTMVQQRTADARPSVANARADYDASVYDLEDSNPDEDDFAPEAEGTPQHLRQAKRRLGESASSRSALNQRSTNAQPPSKKRKSADVSEEPTALPPSQAKRKNSSVPDHALEREISPDGELDAGEMRRPPSVTCSHSPRAARATSEDVLVISSSQSTHPLHGSALVNNDTVLPDGDYIVPSTAQQGTNPAESPSKDLPTDVLQDTGNETAMDPTSSSPAPLEVAPAPHDSEEFADPVTQLSPQPVKQKSKADKPKPIPTATLQSLLPKRRQPPRARHRQSEYDFGSDSGNEDAAELERRNDAATPRAKSGRRNVAGVTAESRESNPCIKAKERRGKASQRPRKSATTQSAHRSAKTYGKAVRLASNKENDGKDFEDVDGEEATDLPEVSMHDVVQSIELEEAKRKFAEVDIWDMEFESLGVDEHRSSSQQWR
ncbi:hypothetical protein BAUCODRAFT_142088 [Baudoinia panamericana UAMH 10762]|uniref:Uncharacterized protein n=1 Tax=Baudoinia panamericana (strain UAMH 10762) TaxID=717646 RepID=M2N4J1_BAUPA|nr:uncharacterized protein BAUCODRAFT_142088 [Baudoinia panamericana UAMH 10762]EMC93635.1 hypothetical protein BAUCODRAFT_142088 [Baudoinia panamericana UAMH 10762]